MKIKEKIDGYLLAVEKLIEISDTAFRRLIELSNQG
jgi:D-hexose-6-phosphate mutarotase